MAPDTEASSPSSSSAVSLSPTAAVTLASNVRSPGDIGRQRKKSVTSIGSAAAAARASFLSAQLPIMPVVSEASGSRSSSKDKKEESGRWHSEADSILRQASASPPPSPQRPMSSGDPSGAAFGEDRRIPADEDLDRRPASSGFPHGLRPTKRPFMLRRNDLQYDVSLGLTQDGCKPDTSSDLALSVRSAPSGGSRFGQSRLPNVFSTSAPLSTRGGSTKDSRVSGFAKAFSSAPAWSLRYAEFVGSVVEPEDVEQTNGLRAKIKAAQKSESQIDSVFLAKQGKDKRLAKQDEMMMRKVKPSRYTARRAAISGWGQSRLQVKAAVKMHTKRFPEHMRMLNKQCEAVSGNKKVTICAKQYLGESQITRLVKETGMVEEEIQSLLTSFTRYDLDDSGYLDRSEVRQVLNDLGLQPRGCDEKVEVHEIICDADAEGLRHYNFEVFVKMVKSVRERLRQIQLSESIVIFEEADKDGNGSLSMEEVLWILDKRLQMMLRDAERPEVVAIFQQCDAANNGQVNFEEFQDFVQRARARLMTMRREEELTIAKAFLLPSETVNEFRMDLPQLWGLFKRYDHNHQSMVSRPFLKQLLIDVGECPIWPHNACETTQAVNLFIESYGKEENSFPVFLKIVHELRNRSKASVQDLLYERFTSYDKYKLGQLHYSETYQILADFTMLPKSREEQQGIVTVMERLDANGSGTFDFEEFQDFFQRLTEQVQLAEREAERKDLLKMGFTEFQLQVLRSTFYDLRPNIEGKIAQIGMTTAMHATRDVLCPAGGVDDQIIRDITRNAQKAPDHYITFQEFIQTLKTMMMGKEADTGTDDGY